MTTVTIPANTSAPASYRVIAVADALEQQAELDETGNALASETVVNITPFRPDLMLTAVGVPATGAAGKTLTITTTVRNGGPAPAGAFVLRFYLSSGTADRAVARATVAYDRALARFGLRQTVRLLPGGHDGRFWRAQLPDALAYAFSRPVP